MTVLPLVMDLADRGIFPCVNGKKIFLTPMAQMTDALRVRIRNDKPALMANLVKLQQFPEWNWSTFEVRPARFKAFAELVMISEMREQGIVPDHYSATVHCESCNQDVPHFPMDANTVIACVWCINGRLPPSISDSSNSSE